MTFRLHHQRDRQESGLPQRIRLLKCITRNCRARFVNANSRRSRTLRRMVNEARRRVAVIGFPVPYSTEPINGVMISGFDAPGIGTKADRTCFTHVFFLKVAARVRRSRDHTDRRHASHGETSEQNY
jgi:hypothetical protein